jgi:hypothetical protein
MEIIIFFYAVKISDNFLSSKLRTQELSITAMFSLEQDKEVFEDTKGVIQSVNQRTDNPMAKRKRTNGQTKIYKIYT